MHGIEIDLEMTVDDMGESLPVVEVIVKNSLAL